MDDENAVELSEAIGAVRDQLIAAQLAAHRTVAGRALRFEVGKVVVEFTGEVKKSRGGSGGASFWVVKADGKADLSTGTAQKISVELVPHSPFMVHDDVDAPPPS